MTHRYYFHSRNAMQIVDAIAKGMNSVRVSLDLNLSEKEWAIAGNSLVMDEASSLETDQLIPVCSAGNKIFYYKSGELQPVEFRGDGYYKLVPTPTVPTLEINGIKMHRSKDIDPLTDARLKAGKVVRKGDIVLDTCGGLGYSALFAVKAGAKTVISIEKDNAVIFLRTLNPWTPGDRRIDLIHADICRRIIQFNDQQFDSIIHDPPRFTSATGDLYGKPFYHSLFRVLKLRGRLFHYTGSPKKIKEQDRFLKNTQKRLESAGFQRVGFHNRLQGFLAEKSEH